jgi:glutaminyl-peptide cyclotransferase
MQNHQTKIHFSELSAAVPRIPGLVLLALTLLMGLSACRSTPQVNQNAPPTPTPSPTPVSAFDGQRAFEHVRKQVEFGPRPAGSAELAKTREYIIRQLHSFMINVLTDEFSPKTPIGMRKMVNVTGEIPGESSDVIIISSHYDTKLYKEFSFVGANDAGSSTGAVLELARVIAASGKKPRFTYRFVFFDGEEAFCADWDECKNNGEPDNTYGSRRYVAQLKEKNQVKIVRAMILLDMVGYKELEFGRELDLSTKWLIDVVWMTAQELGHGQKFLPRNESVGGDDHEPFVRAGIDSIDIIQLPTYPFWHTAQDTLDKISPDSLKIVGDVVLTSLPRIEQRLSGKSGG